MTTTLNGTTKRSSTTINTVPTAPSEVKPTKILHRTTWRPPIGVSSEGSYITLQDGRTVYDGVGGAAVACIGNSHPKVLKALKDQLDAVSCKSQISSDLLVGLLKVTADVYNMQLSNEPAEALANRLVETSNGAFELVGYASGGQDSLGHSDILRKV